MPTKNPRVNVVLEKPLYGSVNRLARRDGVSLSLKIRDMVREYVELHEDIALGRIGGDRLKTFHKKRALKHGEVF